jgi:hypothetical protein
VICSTKDNLRKSSKETKGDYEMKTRLLTQLPGMTHAVLLALTVGQALVVRLEARAGDGGKLEGTWLIEATRVDCATRVPLPGPGNPFPALHTYMRGGTMLDSGAGSPPPLAVTRSTAHGIWEHTGGQTFRVRFRFFNFNAAGVHVSTNEVTVERSLIKGNHAETDEIIGVGTAKLFDPAGNLLREGCNMDKGQRFEFEE